MSTARFHPRLSLCLLFAALLISASAGQGQATISIIWAGAERERVSAFAPLPQPQTSPELWSKAAGREKPHDDRAACCDGVNEKSPNLIVRCLGWDAASYAIRFAPGMISGTQQLIPWRGSEAGNVIPLGQPSTPSSHTPERRNT